jgi:hypothetical protein
MFEFNISKVQVQGHGETGGYTGSGRAVYIQDSYVVTKHEISY